MDRKKLLFSFLVSFSTIPWPLTSYAGIRTSGGALAVVCRDVNQNIRSAELLDIYEARQEGKILRPSTNSAVGDWIQYLRVLKKLTGHPVMDQNQESLEKTVIESAMKEIVMTPPGQWLQRLFDEGPLDMNLPPNCYHEQLALFYDEAPVLTVSSDIWSHLDATNRAAMWAHESIYHLMRLKSKMPSPFGIKTTMTSKVIRPLVGAMFSQTTLEPEYGKFLTNAFICTAQVGVPLQENFDVYFYGIGVGLHSESLEGHSVIKVKKIGGVTLSEPLIFPLLTAIRPSDVVTSYNAPSYFEAVHLLYPTKNMRYQLPLPAPLSGFLALEISASRYFRFDFLDTHQQVTKSAFLAGCAEDFLGTEL